MWRPFLLRPTFVLGGLYGRRRQAAIECWTDLARLFGAAAIRMVLAEQNDEWQDGRRNFRPETMASIDVVIDHEEVSPALPMAS